MTRSPVKIVLEKRLCERYPLLLPIQVDMWWLGEVAVMGVVAVALVDPAAPVGIN